MLEYFLIFFRRNIFCKQDADQGLRHHVGPTSGLLDDDDYKNNEYDDYNDYAGYDEYMVIVMTMMPMMPMMRMMTMMQRCKKRLAWLAC